MLTRKEDNTNETKDNVLSNVPAPNRDSETPDFSTDILRQRLQPNITRVGVNIDDEGVVATRSNVKTVIHRRLKGTAPVEFEWARVLLEGITLLANLAIEKISFKGVEVVSHETVQVVVLIGFGVYGYHTVKKWKEYKRIKKFIPESNEELIENIWEDLVKTKNIQKDRKNGQRKVS